MRYVTDLLFDYAIACIKGVSGAKRLQITI